MGVIRDEITLEKVGGARMIVFGCPREMFSVAEVTNKHTANVAERDVALVLSSADLPGDGRQTPDLAGRGRREQTTDQLQFPT